MKKLCFVMCGLVGLLPCSAGVVITEAMQSNIYGLYDAESREFPDSWVELHNDGCEAVDLADWRIGIKEKPSKCYKLPSITLEPGGYTVVYCDKTGSGRHADFRLDSDESNVYLYMPDNTLADKVLLPAMAAPQVGRSLCTDGIWRYSLKPTPGEPNRRGTDYVMGEPEFSVAGGLFDAPLEVTVSVPDEDTHALLAVTTDGREPTSADIVEGRSKTIMIDCPTSVRAKLLDPNRAPRPSTVNSYILHPRETDLMVVAITVEPDYFYSPEQGILDGSDESNPNWLYDWRRPINIEFLEKGRPAVGQLCEIRVKGASTRVFSQKSLAVYSHKRFGTSRFDTSTFWSEKPEVTACKSIELRNSGQDFRSLHVRDALAQRLVGTSALDVDWSAYRPVICYINGEYKGIYDLRERSNEDNVEANYDGLEDIDMVEGWYEIKTGDDSACDDLLSVFYNPDLTFDEAAANIHLESFLADYVLNIYGYNYDSIHGNVVLWRPQEIGAKWRTMIKDVDSFILHDTTPESNYFDYVDEHFNSPEDYKSKSAIVYELFLSDERGMEMLTDYLAVALGDWLREDRVFDMMTEMVEEIDDEYPYHLEAYGEDLTRNDWRRYNKKKVGNFIRARHEALYSQMQERFGLGSLFDLEVDTEGIPATINDVPLSEQTFSGKWFDGKPLVIKGGYKGTYIWTIENTTGADKDVSIVEQETLDLTNRLHDKISIRMQTSSSVGVMPGDSALEWTLSGRALTPRGEGEFAVYSLDGRQMGRVKGGETLQLPQGGIYFMRRGASTVKLIVK